MARPSYTVTITFAADVVVAGVQEIEIARGREDAADRVEAGTCRLVLENSDGRFSPENGASPYNGYVRPGRLVRVEATFAAVTYGLFYGHVQRWIPRPLAGDEQVVVECVDPFLRFQGQALSTAFASALTGTRLAALLDAMGWSAALRDLNAGRSTLPAFTLSSETGLAHLQDVVEAEGGLCWVEGDGKVTFRDRHARYLDTVSTTSQITCGGASGLGFEGLEYDYAIDQVQNDVRITRTGGVEQVASDATSQTDYGVRTLRRTSPHYTNDNEALGFAQWVVSQRKAPLPRLHRLVLQGGGSDDLWVQMLSRRLNDRITVVHTFPGALALNRQFWIEGVEHKVRRGLNEHATTWLLSAVDLTTYVILDTSTLNSAHVLGF